MNDRIGLAEAIAQVRADLTKAHNEGTDEGLRFRVGEVKLDFQVEMTREGAGHADVKVWVVSIGGEGRVSSTHTQSMSLTLAPQVWTGTAWEDARITGSVTGRPPVPPA
jgi:hypothetical protein